MRVFLSWSGNHSIRIAHALKCFLSALNCGLDPFLSASDIGAGRVWRDELHKQLESANMCVVCLTPEALRRSQWLFFEAGALSVDGGQCKLICPYLIGLAESEISGPLDQFQAKPCTRQGTIDLVNALLSDSCTRDQLNKLIEPHWCRFESIVQQIEQEIGRMRGYDNHINAQGCEQLLDIYMDAVAHHLLGVAHEQLQRITHTLTPEVVEKIHAVRELLKAKPKEQLNHLLDILTEKGIPGPLHALIARFDSELQRCRAKLRSFYSESVSSGLTEFLAQKLPAQQLVDYILSGLTKLASYDLSVHAPTLADVYTMIETQQQQLKKQVVLGDFRMLLEDPATNEAFADFLVPATSQISANVIPLGSPKPAGAPHEIAFVGLSKPTLPDDGSATWAPI